MTLDRSAWRELRESGGARSPLHRGRGRRRRRRSCSCSRAASASARASEEAVAQFDELIRRGRNTLLELRGRREGLRRVVRPAAPRLRLRRGGHGRGALPRRRSCSAGRRSSPTRARSSRRASGSRRPTSSSSSGRRRRSRRSPPTTQTAIVVLTHDDKFDEPALIGALATEAFYIGALGSRRNQERRRERLLEAGVDEDGARPDHGPVRPRHRGRHAGGDRALDPRRDRSRSARAARAGS